MRSRTTTCPPASTMQHEMAMPALRASSMAVAIILLAPSWVRRLVSAMYMAFPVLRDAKFCVMRHPSSRRGRNLRQKQRAPFPVGNGAHVAVTRQGRSRFLHALLDEEPAVVARQALLLHFPAAGLEL